jgi:uncharacterized membrane protein YuzA (DUF378 family)
VTAGVVVVVEALGHGRLGVLRVGVMALVCGLEDERSYLCNHLRR